MGQKWQTAQLQQFRNTPTCTMLTTCLDFKSCTCANCVAAMLQIERYIALNACQMNELSNLFLTPNILHVPVLLPSFL